MSMGKSIVELQREVARLKGKLRAQTERKRLGKERHGLRLATSRRLQFADFVKKQFSMGGKKTLATAAKAAKKEYRAYKKRKG